MRFAITTRWNAGRHTDGESMVEEILDLGFRLIELGYDLRMDLVPGVEKMVSERAVQVVSVHNYCPVPIGAPMPHPELFTLSSPDRRTREKAIEHTTNTIRFAARIGASAVVVHAGNVRMKHMTRKLHSLHEKQKQFTADYEKTKLKLQIARERKVKKQLELLYQGVERLLPVLDETGMKLAIENLPSWESIPTEMELEELLKHFASDHLGYWHDIGHGQVRENLGLINQERWIERLLPFLAGVHIHDVVTPVYDHIMPPKGNIDFARFAGFARMDIPCVLEPTPVTPREEVLEARRFIREAWADDSGGP